MVQMVEIWGQIARCKKMSLSQADDARRLLTYLKLEPYRIADLYPPWIALANQEVSKLKSASCRIHWTLIGIGENVAYR